MIHEFRQRIGVKLFFLLTALISCAIVPLAYVVFSTVSSFGNYTAEVNRDQIKSQAYSYLATIAREQAHKYDAFFSHVEVVSSLMAAQAKEVYDNLEYYAGFPDTRLELAKSRESGMYSSPPEQNVLNAYWGGDHIPAQEMIEMKALLRLDPVFKGVKREIPESLATHLVTVTGIGRYLSYAEDGRAAAYRLPGEWEYDLRNSESLSIFAEKPDILAAGTIWTRAYRDTISRLLITASSPVVDNNGVLRAAIGVDIPLENILSELLEADSSRYSDRISETLFSFLLDDNGRIIAFPRQYLALFGISLAPKESLATGDTLDVSLMDSTLAAIPPVVPKLLGSSADGVEVQLDNARYILHMHTLHLLNWHLVLVTREAQLVSSVERTEQALAGTLRTLVNKFVASAMLIVLIMLVVVFLAVDYFVAPLRRLSEAALRVGRGDPEDSLLSGQK